MKERTKAARIAGLLMFALTALVVLPVTAAAQAVIPGVQGTTFDLVAKSDSISMPDGKSIFIWGYANGAAARAQYPGPTLIVNQGDTINVNLTNTLPVPVSIVFPGHEVTASGGTQDGALTRETTNGGAAVTYTFKATHAGTYHYHSGTNPDLQSEMGLVGAIIVRPYGFNPAVPRAYGAGTEYHHEYLFLMTEMDYRIHDVIELNGAVNGMAILQNTNYLTDYFPSNWFLNGRGFSDTLLANYSPLMPTQPYSALPLVHPGEKLLMRVIQAGREVHPFHHHGQHARIIARDGRLLESAPGAGTDLSQEVFEIDPGQGETVDAIFTWTGQNQGWDIYGTAPHDCVDGDLDGFDDTTSEWCADHGKPLPVVLPGTSQTTIGVLYSGSPFLGSMGTLPPGEGGLNPWAGFAFIWHSHNEKELLNIGIYPGGMITFVIIVPHGIPIP